MPGSRPTTVVNAIIAIALAIVTLPLLAGVATLSLLTFRANPFFVHQRVGAGGRTFRFVKIRTLPPTTGPYLDKYALALATAPALMRAVRRVHLDELPQLWLIASGRMALVGPRPEMPHLLGPLTEAARRERCSVRPGITGLWQISPHSAGLIHERIEYDLLYIQYRTLSLDLWILGRTALKMAFGRTTQIYDVPHRLVRERSVRERPAEVPAASPTKTMDFAGSGSVDPTPVLSLLD